MGWVRDRALGVFFLALFLVSWVGQLVFQWLEFRDEQRAHGASPEFWSGEYWSAFWQATLENWQSEFLQLSAFVIATAYLVYKGSSESGDGEERIEAKLDALLRDRGIDPEVLEQHLPGIYRRRGETRQEHRTASLAALRERNGASS